MKNLLCLDRAPGHRTLVLAFWLGVIATFAGTAPAAASGAGDVAPPVRAIWRDGPGSGFQRGTWHAGVSLGGSIGVPFLGGNESHDLALLTAHVGYVLSQVHGAGRWYGGNWDLVGELVTARQFSPREGFLVGVTPVVRYHFATGSRWTPFVEAGAGLSHTSIRGPDLAGDFEFHLLAGVGMEWFVRDQLALTFEYRFGHVSNAGIRAPNAGLNTNELLLGVSWWF